MIFDEWLQSKRNILLLYYLCESISSGKSLLDDCWPPSALSEEGFGKLKDELRRCMPLDSMIVDLWDWDVHFEDALGYEWFFDAACGDESCVASCSEDLADFFLQQAEDLRLDYDQYDDYESFKNRVRTEATEFIGKWQGNLTKKFG